MGMSAFRVCDYFACVGAHLPHASQSKRDQAHDGKDPPERANAIELSALPRTSDVKGLKGGAKSARIQTKPVEESAPAGSVGSGTPRRLEQADYILRSWQVGRRLERLKEHDGVSPLSRAAPTWRCRRLR